MLPALSHAAQAPGFPQRDVTPAELRRAFTTPPPGYGQVPFWWWTGEPLNRERLLWQLDELHKAGVSGAQINYSHTRSDGWRTEKVEPPIFSDEWWDIFAFMAVESAKRGMGIGMSGYTLDWPGRDNLFRQLGITTDDHAHGQPYGHATSTQRTTRNHSPPCRTKPPRSPSRPCRCAMAVRFPPTSVRSIHAPPPGPCRKARGVSSRFSPNAAPTHWTRSIR